MNKKSKQSLHNICAVYQIKNIKNNKVYIGSSKDIGSRWAEHKRDLKVGVHRNQHLQKSYNKYGKNNFVFEILEYIDDINIQYEREQWWINFKNACNDNYGYNIQNIVLVVPKKTKKVICLETREIFDSLEQASVSKNIDAGSISCCCNKRKLKQAGGYHWMFYDEYKNSSEDIIKSIINNKWKRIICLETGKIFQSYHETGYKKTTIQGCCKKNASGNYATCDGKHFLYEEDYKKLSKEKINEIINYISDGFSGSGEVFCLETGKTYRNAHTAKLKTNISDTSILKVCYGKQKTAGKCHWVFKKDYKK